MAARPSRRRAAPETGPQPEPGEVEDPLAADKRTLAIGLAAMLGLVGVGVVSAQLFVTGGCEPIGEPVAATAGTESVEQLLDGDAVAELEQLLEVELASASVVAGDADRLVPGPDGRVLTVGDVVTALDDELIPATEVTVPGVVVGDGDTLFDVALANELTGQVDAFTAIDPVTLEADGCTDTTVVGEQFAFLLDAGDGQLLQLRIDEDGDLPRAELRDRAGAISVTDLTLPAGPAGVFGDRVTGRTDGEAVVVARRVTADDPGAAIVIADAATGEVRDELDRDAVAEVVEPVGGVLDLDGSLGADVALRVEALTVDGGRAWLTVRADPAEEELPEARPLLLDLDLATGELTAHGPLDGAVVDAALGPDGVLALAVDDGEGAVLVRADAAGEAVGDVPVGEAPGTPRTVRWTPDGPVLVTDAEVAVVGDDARRRTEGLDADVRDVLVDDAGRTLVLVRAVGRSAVLIGTPG